MLSNRRAAQLGLFAACMVLVCSLFVVVSGSKDGSQSDAVAVAQSHSSVAALATANLSLSSAHH